MLTRVPSFAGSPLKPPAGREGYCQGGWKLITTWPLLAWVGVQVVGSFLCLEKSCYCLTIFYLF